MIVGLLKQKPEERLSIPEILEHKWLNEGETEDNDIYERDLKVSNDTPPDINELNIGNLFWENHSDTKLTYTNFCYIANDFYTQHVGNE